MKKISAEEDSTSKTHKVTERSFPFIALAVNARANSIWCYSGKKGEHKRAKQRNNLANQPIHFYFCSNYFKII